ncbi:MAG: deoxynucleoside kinase, partial [Bacteroidota bacterium]
LLFARNNLQDDEYRLFTRLYKVLTNSFPAPDLLLYLHRPVEVLLANIRKRGREYEQNIQPEYLLKIQQAYFDYFKMQIDSPVVILDLGDLDFNGEHLIYQGIVDVMSTRYKPGIHHVALLV